MPVLPDRHFNEAVRSITRRLYPTGYDVSEEDTLTTLEALHDHVKRTGRMQVYSGASDKTIFGDAEINLDFRAWHDYYHYRYQLPFTPEGEAMVCQLQKADVLKYYGDSELTRFWRRLIDIEVIGQVQHFVETGQFPEDQMTFTLKKLEVS